MQIEPLMSVSIKGTEVVSFYLIRHLSFLKCSDCLTECFLILLKHHLNLHTRLICNFKINM